MLLQTVKADRKATDKHEQNKQQLKDDSSINSSHNISVQRRQDNGFDFMSYFMGRQAPQQQQANAGQQQLQQAQQPLNLQQQHQLQQQQLQQQQLRQQQQLQQLQQQQLLQLQQQQQAPRSADVIYQDNAIQQQNPPQVVLQRDGGYGGVGLGNTYQSGGYGGRPKEIALNLGGNKSPNVISVGNILTLLPRIMNVLSAGGKVMFGVELGNNFYFGPVGAKPIGKPIYG
ncbi:hypothetical protein X975_09060, partial [Stegodyphus mimosarum]